jgi:hypothetical protein
MRIKDERDELKNMLDKAPEKIDKNVAVPGEDLVELAPEPLISVNFDDLKKQCEKDARKMIKNAISFMIPLDMIRENKYLKDKFNVDVMSLSGMIYQLKSNEIVQKTLMEQISLGMAHPRMFEVYAGMSKTLGDLNKQLLQTVEAIKETYKGFKEDVREKRTEAIGPGTTTNGMLTSGDGSIITRGTKELINRVKAVKNQNGNDQSYIDEEKLIPNINIDDAQLIH